MNGYEKIKLFSSDFINIQLRNLFPHFFNSIQTIAKLNGIMRIRKSLQTKYLSKYSPLFVKVGKNQSI